METNQLFLEVHSIADLCLAPIETVVTLFTIKYCDSHVSINLVVTKKKCNEERSNVIDLSGFTYTVLEVDKLPRYASTCDLPNLIVNETTCVAGLCATLRQIVKSKCFETPLHYSKALLGFKDACLLACSESSIWTKFCEVDLISTLKSIHGPTSSKDTNDIPESIARFECHMSQPVRLHNLYKYTMSKKFAVKGTTTGNRDKIPEHIYAEGSQITLADIIIFVCIHTFFTLHALKCELLELIPLTAKWYARMLSSEMISESLSCLRYLESPSFETRVTSYVLPNVENHSLYKSDPKRYKPRNRIYTKQVDIDDSFALISELGVSIDLASEPFGSEMTLNWNEIPFEATPEGGALPETRLKRKFEQLENLCRPVMALAKIGDIVVDFCSGGGHLGILIAYLLPGCEVVLLENKEESLNRAKKRVQKLQLTNIRFYQCNLDYYKGHFDIGVSLHACGVATDLVIEHCVSRNAIFVCCPCCYGSVHDCHHIKYPRSNLFKSKIDPRSYLVLGHSADQTHDKNNAKTNQGYKCMSIIDTDRKLHAEQYNYVVHLAKLVPENCTPKNHLLVGIPEIKS
ncbi:glutathione S-transferase C-terminal domain-containing protein homolog [Diprion similis]|uniref:glutathione S-transferase C-terminal domain-containing protein homolog n=1 Tax=Diprion similis TaxID=362088 RepID=UPI001EF82C75|nr:glutathione S-transferase C-terminal domain-containing protein homolog [Diprion similis]